MDKNYLVKLTNDLYRLTLLFPKKEPLRYKMRELATEILADFIDQERSVLLPRLGGHPADDPVPGDNLEQKLDIIDCFFEVAKEQNWAMGSQPLEIQREYSKMKDELKRLQGRMLSSTLPFPSRQEEERVQPIVETEMLSDSLSGQVNKNRGRTSGALKVSDVLTRQQKILEILKEKGKAQVWEFKQIFPEVTKRTLRRNFEQLLKQGLVERIGERNETFYRVREQA